MSEKPKNRGGNTVAVVTELAEPIAAQLGLSLWDVRFVKEGAMWYLRLFIDKEEGVTIEDCEAMSRAIDKPLDDLDPIEQSYCLEVCSPGIERELVRPEHFEAMAGELVCVTLYRPRDGQKEIIATLLGMRDKIILLELEDGTTLELPQKETVSVRIYAEF
ncbi:MAG: ribosome maturation factor RimP [Ruminococcaceae bacterium]|nr:ribosome maturation factor RimP [Oscillospiraceae bacterium]